MCPLILYTDDFSGNKSRQWSKFDCWALLLAGLPKEENSQFKNIHLIATSNRVTFLDMAGSIVDELILLEDGITMYDSFIEQEVLVVAPVFCFLCDNPRHSELINHLTGSPRKYCRMCEVSINLKSEWTVLYYVYTST